jgi:hypothetical protein
MTSRYESHYEYPYGCGEVVITERSHSGCGFAIALLALTALAGGLIAMGYWLIQSGGAL